MEKRFGYTMQVGDNKHRFCEFSAPGPEGRGRFVFGQVFGDDDCSDEEDAVQRKADAQRIAACWNACIGVPTDKLGSVARLVAAARTVEHERTNATGGDWAELFDALAPFVDGGKGGG